MGQDPARGWGRGCGAVPVEVALPRGPSLAGRMWHRSGTNWVVAASRVGLWCHGGSDCAEEPQPAEQRNRFSFPAGEGGPVCGRWGWVDDVGLGG